MTEIPFIKTGDTVAISATFPNRIDFTEVDSISIYVGEGPIETGNVSILDKSTNEVGVDVSQFDIEAGFYKVEWEVVYSDGTVETLPSDGYDTLKVYDELK